jgi:hypothetical protein
MTHCVRWQLFENNAVINPLTELTKINNFIQPPGEIILFMRCKPCIRALIKAGFSASQESAR